MFGRNKTKASTKGCSAVEAAKESVSSKQGKMSTRKSNSSKSSK